MFTPFVAPLRVSTMGFGPGYCALFPRQVGALLCRASLRKVRRQPCASRRKECAFFRVDYDPSCAVVSTRSCFCRRWTTVPVLDSVHNRPGATPLISRRSFERLAALLFASRSALRAAPSAQRHAGLLSGYPELRVFLWLPLALPPP